MLLSIGPGFLLALFRDQIIMGSFLCFVIGVSLFAFLKSMVLYRIFQKYVPDEEKG